MPTCVSCGSWEPSSAPRCTQCGGELVGRKPGVTPLSSREDQASVLLNPLYVGTATLTALPVLALWVLLVPGRPIDARHVVLAVLTTWLLILALVETPLLGWLTSGTPVQAFLLLFVGVPLACVVWNIVLVAVATSQ